MGAKMSARQALIIEDNREIGDLYITTLELVQYECELIADGKAAVERLDGAVPDLIILDMNLPGVSGNYIYKKIRADSRYDATPIIVATANILVAEMLKDELADTDHLLVKPISPRQIHNIVTQLV